MSAAGTKKPPPVETAEHAEGVAITHVQSSQGAANTVQGDREATRKKFEPVWDGISDPNYYIGGGD